MPKRILALAALAGALTLGQPAQADEQELVDDSARVLAQFLDDADVLRTLGRARGVLVIPDYVKAGFILGRSWECFFTLADRQSLGQPE